MRLEFVVSGCRCKTGCATLRRKLGPCGMVAIVDGRTTLCYRNSLPSIPPHIPPQILPHIPPHIPSHIPPHISPHTLTPLSLSSHSPHTCTDVLLPLPHTTTTTPPPPHHHLHTTTTQELKCSHARVMWTSWPSCSASDLPLMS